MIYFTPSAIPSSSGVYIDPVEDKPKFPRLKIWLRNAEAVNKQWDKAIETGTSTKKANEVRDKHLDLICENIIKEVKSGLYDDGK